MIVLTSSSVTRSSLAPERPSSDSTRRLDLSSSHTSGAATEAMTAMLGAARAAIRSASRSASCLGTSSPRISEKYVMATTTTPTPMVPATASGTPRVSKNSRSRSPRVAPEKAPDSTPIRLMPICADDRNLPGSSASFSATAAPLLPSAAMTFSRAGRAETTASSDMDSSPFRRTRTMTMTISTYMD